MSATMMQEVLRISDRFYGVGDTESMERQQRLYNCLIVVAICHIIMLIAFWQMHDYEKVHPRIISDVEVQFEIDPPPPIDLPKPKIKIIPADLEAPVKGDDPNAGEGRSNAAKPDETKLDKEIQGPLENKAPAKPEVSLRMPKDKPATPIPTLTVERKGKIQSVPSPPIPSNPLTSPNIPIATTPAGNPNAGPDAAGNNGTQTGGTGQGNQGTGEGLEGTGNKAGTQGGTPAPMKISARVGNIAPYRRALLTAIAKNWHPDNDQITLKVFMVIGRDGRLLEAKVAESSGKKKADKAALKAVEETPYPPLPEWFEGQSIPFLIDLQASSMTQRGG